MARRINRKWADIQDGQQSPLNFAVSTRDRGALQMVKEAVKHRQVMLAFQPAMQAADQTRVAFYEGLIRVLDETGRIIPAKDFIGEVENTEIGRILDTLALEKGLKTLAEQPHIRLSINMSARSIGYQRWMRALRTGLERDPTVGERLILEISESSAMTVPELVVDFMGKMQRHGIAFALDDFGAGFTSFKYLKEFYFDIIKIDGQFIRGISNNADNQVITRAMTAIAQQFDMFTVAGFVESEADAKLLASIGVDCLQGYYFAAPTVRPPWVEDQLKRHHA